MKNIEIKGKPQKDRIIKAINPNDNNIVATRDCVRDMPELIFNYDYQLILINKIFIDFIDNFEFKKECLREINKKLLSYKNQDIIKSRYNDNNITLDETIEKLVSSRLKCKYCYQKMLIFYNKVRDGEQWTLDRINNDLSHTCENVVACCLKCNLQRRCQNKDKFLFTKQLKIVKE